MLDALVPRATPSELVWLEANGRRLLSGYRLEVSAWHALEAAGVPTMRGVANNLFERVLARWTSSNPTD